MLHKIEKVMTLCCAVVLIVVATVSGTLAFENWGAYDWAKNNPDQFIDVKLVQQQRSYDAQGNTAELVPMSGQPVLIPLVESAQYDGTNFDRYGMPMAQGYVDQIVRVQNDGNTPAYVRVIAAVPADLDNANDAGHNALHWNLGNRFMPEGNFSSQNPQNKAFDRISWEYLETTAVDGVKCNLYVFTYRDPIGAGETTQAAAITGFYLDRDANVVDGHILLDGMDTGFADDDVTVHIKAQAVQAYGFSSAERAFGASGLKDNPWEVKAKSPYVSTYEELVNAFAEGWKNIVLTNGIVIEGDRTGYSRIVVSEDTKLDLNGFTITNATTSTNNQYNMLITVKNDAELTVVSNGGCIVSSTASNDNPCLFYLLGNARLNLEDGQFFADDHFGVWADENSKAVINGGTYESTQGELVYVLNNGQVEINGGMFIADPSGEHSTTHLLNRYDKTPGTILVRGGTFVNFNPADCSDGSFVCDGYKVVSETKDNGDVWYTVVPE